MVHANLGPGAVLVDLEREEPRALLLRRRNPPVGLWENPGGMLEEGEDFAACARRETLEETGVRPRSSRCPGGPGSSPGGTLRTPSSTPAWAFCRGIGRRGEARERGPRRPHVGHGGPSGVAAYLVYEESQTCSDAQGMPLGEQRK